MLLFFFVMSTVPTEVDTYCNTPSLGDALPLVADRARLDRSRRQPRDRRADLLADMGVAARIGRDVAGGGAARARLRCGRRGAGGAARGRGDARSEEHTSELQSLMRISYAVFCLKNKITILLTLSKEE